MVFISALTAAGYEQTEAYTHHRGVLARILIYDGSFEAKQRRDASCQQQKSAGERNEYKLGWHGGGDSGKVSFLESAKRLPHPAQHENDDLPTDLCEAVRFAVSKGSCITEWRDRAVARLDAAAAD